MKEKNIKPAAILPAGLYTVELLDFRLERKTELEIVWVLQILQGDGATAGTVVEYSQPASAVEKTTANFETLKLDKNNLTFALTDKDVLRGRKLLCEVEQESAGIRFVRDLSPESMPVAKPVVVPF